MNARDAAQWLTPDGIEKMRKFATGLSPDKTVMTSQAEGIARVRQLGMPITPYTFRASAVTGYPDVRAEMAHYIEKLQVDGVITDNPDQMPARAPKR